MVGGGPAGLYLAYLLKRASPRLEVVVLERNRPDATYGFGVVFSDAALGYLADADQASFTAVSAAMEVWDDLTIAKDGNQVRVDGNRFSAIARLRLLTILHDLCASVGVDLRFGTTVEGLDDLSGADLVVGADGVHSRVRQDLAGHFAQEVTTLTNRFAWYGTARTFPTLTLTFRTTEDGVFVAHHYRYSPTMSTFIVECDAPTFDRAGLGRRSPASTRAYAESLFAPELQGHPLVENRSVWRSFELASCARWHTDRVVLIGDALRTVHFSIGSGTRLALEDAIALAGAFVAEGGRLPDALARFEAERRPVVEALVAAAARSSWWYEAMGERAGLDVWDLAHDYMTRSGRMDDGRLAAVAPRFVAELARRGRVGVQ
ncbi:MAG TPA: FAD-dependent monooxygenase [Acidimicrobiales bacterium]|nr:FAD-dependent monooxygenase [Acidimicrobiales bacterium]